ncbi:MULTISPECIES: cellulase family glycosylhydrolase [Methylotenera]|uniref:cellulase family glycosylhydrolase n=1 Tax=Methylotenera TaxID=359407 RepID=UPI00035D5A0D|nr:MULTISPECIES: cellulase family glycosylhydrolase [Methylotenera]
MTAVLKRLFAAILLLAGFFQAPISLAADSWVPVKDISLMVEEGSILDFSALVPPAKPIQARIIVNSQGHLTTDNQPEKAQRFLIGSLGFGVNLGSFPSHELTDLYIKQYRMHGYNMVRLDFVESILMEGRKGDFDYNPEQLDRFYYLVSALKKNGIYLILNGLSNSNGGYGNVEERWIGKKGLQAGVYFETDKQAHWKKLIATMYGAVNPYTGVSILKDPTLAGLILVNEGNLVFMHRNGVSPALKPHFAKWLKAKYGGQAALKTAWGNELKSSENIDLGEIDFSAPDAWTSKRMADVQQFFSETENKTAAWMIAYLRGLGYQGLASSYNLWHSPAANASRGQLPWVDMHHYFAHPEYAANGNMKVRQDSMLKDGASYIRELAVTKHIGKPFTVSEHGQVFWNPYRRESGLALPTYAAFQSWDGICQHSGAVDLTYAPSVGRKNFINPFAVGTDPISRATETLAALLYLRGDVAPAKHRLSVKFGPDDAFVKSAHLGSTPSDISKLSLVTGIGLDWLGKAKQTQYDGQVDFNQPGLKLFSNGVLQPVKSSGNLAVKIDGFVQKYAQKIAYKASKVSLIADERWAARLQNLRDANWLTSANQSSADTEVYQSDTGEILLDAEQKRITVITPKTEAVVFDEPKAIQLNYLSVLSAESGALVAVSAMDNQPLASSKRMLVVLSTDARNSDMQFSDATNETVTQLGKSPVLVRANKVKVALRNANQKQLKVFSTNLRGQRVDAIPVKQTPNTIEFEMDISKLSHGATTYFEISI